MNHLFPHPRDDIILSQTIGFMQLGKDNLYFVIKKFHLFVSSCFLNSIIPHEVPPSIHKSVLPFLRSSSILQMPSHPHQPLPHRNHGYSFLRALLIISNQQAFPVPVRLGILH